MTDFRTLVAQAPRVHTDPGSDPIAWFDLEQLISAGADEAALLAWAHSQGGKVRAWPEPVLSGTAQWLPKLPPGRYLTIPARQL